MKTRYKQIILIAADTVIVIFSHWLAAFLRYDGDIPQQAVPAVFICMAISIPVVIVLGILLGSYGDLYRHAGIDALFRQGVVAAGSAAVLLVVKYSVYGQISGSITTIYVILLFMLTAGVRIVPRGTAWAKSLIVPKPHNPRRAVIVGAGDTGAMLIKNARDTQRGNSFLPVAIVDDDRNKAGLRLSGVKIAGTLNDIEEVCSDYNATEIIVALPNASKDTLHKIYKKCIKTNLPIKSSQNLIDVRDYIDKQSEIASDKTALKSVTIEDLLFRDEIKNDMTAVREFLKDRVVMVTGGAGSIGSELCRQALDSGCRQLIIFDFNENGLYEINEELKGIFDTGRYELCLGSVRDASRLDEVIGRYKPYIVFHAAAHKHVPMMELNPFEAVKNNVAGTKNAVEACIRGGVKKFILISTDKAVNPVNIMGASKRVAELIVKNMKNKGTELAAVRFGNVLGSVGSVVPQFKRQIESGGPVTVTHREITRFFMTISEAVSLVLTAGTLAKDGEIFMLDMGQPVKIYDLATDLIRLSGFKPGTDIEIKEIGLRPGEKLNEELFVEDEQIDSTSHKKLFILNSKKGTGEISGAAFEAGYERIIKTAVEGKDEDALREALFEMVKG